MFKYHMIYFVGKEPIFSLKGLRIPFSFAIEYPQPRQGTAYGNITVTFKIRGLGHHCLRSGQNCMSIYFPLVGTAPKF